MESTSESLLAAGKGILAADESYPTIKKRFAAIDLASTEESRRNYRDMLFTTPGLNEFISGVILFDETLRQKTNDGVPMPEALAKQGIIPGIKVDMGAAAFAHFADEKVTQGLDGLRDRLIVYRELGVRVLAVAPGAIRTPINQLRLERSTKLARLAGENPAPPDRRA
jgi:fructose-bisphosphate aldolase class I